MTEAEFWEATPRQLGYRLEAGAMKLQSDYRLARYAAWVIENYRRKLPSLASALSLPHTAKRATWQNQLAQARALHTLFTGEVLPAAEAPEATPPAESRPEATAP